MKDTTSGVSEYVLIKKEIATSTIRSRLLPLGLGGEFAWIILLEFMRQHYEGRHLSALSLQSRYPVRESVLNRIIDLFVENDIIALNSLRQVSDNDNYDSFSITERGICLVQQIINPKKLGVPTDWYSTILEQ